MHKLIEISWNYLQKLGEKFLVRKREGNPAIWSRSISKQFFWFFNLSSDSHAKCFNASAFGRLDRWTNSQKSRWDPKSIQFKELSQRLTFKFGKSLSTHLQ